MRFFSFFMVLAASTSIFYCKIKCRDNLVLGKVLECSSMNSKWFHVITWKNILFTYESSGIQVSWMDSAVLIIINYLRAISRSHIKTVDSLHWRADSCVTCVPSVQKRHQNEVSWRRSSVFIVNQEHVQYINGFLLWTLLILEWFYF